ncbi:FGGY-family carbohydrate kinase [Spiractinospora alimapuensis]|uniref:FGGY-family carbohydrate kinase n=1 Tax=Spiractinospora alimapuensis TaxID=2820884 RepID=UPI001F314757|nr:FGGY-family carbohydrate kinase [Spiractinospora alimapuensis]QVQ53846.1 FGGY-family carbohydrate kinase [Spiractinospora alimapuensis]
MSGIAPGATPLLLGIDIGTASSKGVLATPEGDVVAQATVAHGVSRPHPGWVEQDADGVWWHDVVHLSRTLLAEVEPSAVQGVCVSGIGPVVLPADAAGRPLRPAILYGVDTRAVDIAAELESTLGAEEVLRRTGSRLSSQSAGPKVTWLARNEPDIWGRTQRLFMASSYAVFRLTGAYVLDHHSASQSQPLYDRERNTWIPEWAEVVAPGLTLPELRWPSDVAGTVSAAAAAETGIPEGTPVAVGTIDAWAEAESADVRESGDVMIMYGSTMFFIAVTDQPVIHENLWGTIGQHAGMHTLAGGMASSGAITAWFRDIAGERPFAELVAEAEAVPAGSGGLLALPYFDGERTPFADPDARGVIAGLTLRHGAGHVYRSLLEATAFGARHNLDAFADVGVPLRRIVAVGGGATSDLWPAIVSDTTGHRQEIPTRTIGAAYGDAKFAAVGVGLADRATRWNPPRSVIEPGTDAPTYEKLYRLYRRLHENTRDIQHELAHL